MREYLDLCQRILDEGVWEQHLRSGKRRKTVINADMVYDCSDDTVPMLTTKKVYWKSAVAEMLGYVLGYSNTEQFNKLGTKTWDANANDNEAWLHNINRSGDGDMGRVYGVQGRRWLNFKGQEFDQLQTIVDKLNRGIDDGRLILTFHNPGELELGCLPACMHTHTFSLVGNTLHLTSYQRSCDVPLGLPFNMLQCAWLLKVIAGITGNVPGKVFHKIVNAHIYEDQISGVQEQVTRTPKELPKMVVNPQYQSLDDLRNYSVADGTNVFGYEHHPAIKFAFTT